MLANSTICSTSETDKVLAMLKTDYSQKQKPVRSLPVCGKEYIYPVGFSEGFGTNEPLRDATTWMNLSNTVGCPKRLPTV